MARPNTTKSALQSQVNTTDLDSGSGRIQLSPLWPTHMGNSLSVLTHRITNSVWPRKRGLGSWSGVPRLRPRLLRERDILSARSPFDERDEHRREGRA